MVLVGQHYPDNILEQHFVLWVIEALRLVDDSEHFLQCVSKFVIFCDALTKFAVLFLLNFHELFAK